MDDLIFLIVIWGGLAGMAVFFGTMHLKQNYPDSWHRMIWKPYLLYVLTEGLLLFLYLYFQE